MDGIFRDRENICAIFDLEFERPPLQLIGDEIPLQDARGLIYALYFHDQGMLLVILAVFGYNRHHLFCLCLNEYLLFESSLFHGMIILCGSSCVKMRLFIPP